MTDFPMHVSCSLLLSYKPEASPRDIQTSTRILVTVGEAEFKRKMLERKKTVNIQETSHKLKRFYIDGSIHVMERVSFNLARVLSEENKNQDPYSISRQSTAYLGLIRFIFYSDFVPASAYIL